MCIASDVVASVDDDDYEWRRPARVPVREVAARLRGIVIAIALVLTSLAILGGERVREGVRMLWIVSVIVAALHIASAYVRARRQHERLAVSYRVTRKMIVRRAAEGEETRVKLDGVVDVDCVSELPVTFGGLMAHRRAQKTLGKKHPAYWARATEIILLGPNGPIERFAAPPEVCHRVALHVLP